MAKTMHAIDPSNLYKRLVLMYRRTATRMDMIESMGISQEWSESILRRMESESYLFGTFEDIYYVRNPEEFRTKTLEMTHYEIVALRLEKKGVENR